MQPSIAGPRPRPFLTHAEKDLHTDRHTRGARGGRSKRSMRAGGPNPFSDDSMRNLCTLAVAGAAAFASSLSAQVSFLGVAAGDATDSSIVLWTRAVDASLPAALTLTVDVATDPGFVYVSSGSVATDL